MSMSACLQILAWSDLAGGRDWICSDHGLQVDNDRVKTKHCMAQLHLRLPGQHAITKHWSSALKRPQHIELNRRNERVYAESAHRCHGCRGVLSCHFPRALDAAAGGDHGLRRLHIARVPESPRYERYEVLHGMSAEL